MARKNRRRTSQNPKRGRRRNTQQQEQRPISFVISNAWQEDSVEGRYQVRQISAARAVKNYTCPGCYGIIFQGQAHLVAWRADWLMGDEDAGQMRRHWHTGCWKNRQQDGR